ncbi:hypothetical protein Leryth_025465 [Lithospermum erythrorhizon]|nr:hypothetical protein Leryth_025465 [Lithospermum erythrorhizon]
MIKKLTKAIEESSKEKEQLISEMVAILEAQLKEMSPNLDSISEHRKKVARYDERVGELNTVTLDRDDNAMQAKTSFVSNGMARNNNYAANGASSSRNVLSNNSYENRSGPRVGKDQEDDTPLNLDRIQGYDNKNDALQGMIASLVQKKMEKLM